MTALVTGTGGFGAINIIKSLRAAGNYRIVATDIFPVAAGLFRADRGYLVPKEGTDGKYQEKMLEICVREKVQILIPGNDIEPLHLVTIREELKQNGTVLLTGTKEFLETANDKWRTMQFLHTNGCPCLKTYLPEDRDRAVAEFGFPLVVKPRRGWGQRGFAVVNDPGQLDHQLARLRQLEWPGIIQEYIAESAGEFTTSVMVATDGEILGSIAMKRRLEKGSTREMEIADFPEVRKQIEALATTLFNTTGAIGPMNFQGRVRDGKFYVFEINARFSTTNVVRTAAGFNEVDILVRNFLTGEKQKISNYRPGVAVMFQDYVFVDREKFERWIASGETDRIGEVNPWL